MTITMSSEQRIHIGYKGLAEQLKDRLGYTVQYTVIKRIRFQYPDRVPAPVDIGGQIWGWTDDAVDAIATILKEEARWRR